MYVYPRLDQGGLAKLLKFFISLPETGRLVAVIDHVDSSVLCPLRHDHAATGVDRIPTVELEQLRSRLRATATEHGYPDHAYPRRSPRWADYDRLTARQVHEELRIWPADAGAKDVWAHMNGWLVADLVMWRWGIDDPDEPTGVVARFGYGPRWATRNQFGRLWWRAELLGEPYLDGKLGEDQVTAIFERASIGSNRNLVRALTHAWAFASAGMPGSMAEELMRDATKRLRRRLVFQALYSLPVSTLEAVVHEVMHEARSSLDG